MLPFSLYPLSTHYTHTLHTTCSFSRIVFTQSDYKCHTQNPTKTRFSYHNLFFSLPSFLYIFPIHPHTDRVVFKIAPAFILPIGIELASVVGQRYGTKHILWSILECTACVRERPKSIFRIISILVARTRTPASISTGISENFGAFSLHSRCFERKSCVDFLLWSTQNLCSTYVCCLFWCKIDVIFTGFLRVKLSVWCITRPRFCNSS